MADARFKWSYGDATMEIDGDPSFVDAQLQRLARAISLRIAPNSEAFPVAPPPAEAAAPVTPPTSAEPETAADPPTPAEPPAAADPLRLVEPPLDVSHIFRLTEKWQLQISPEIPGRTRPEQIANTARLLLLGAERLQNIRTIRFSELRAACKAHGCDDDKNLIWALKKRGRGAFIISGRKRRQTLALTDAGRAEAEAMVRALRAPSPMDSTLSAA